MDDLYPRLVAQVLEKGESVSPRGQLTKEIRPFTFQLTNPLNRLITNPARKLNPAFALLEAFQFVTGTTNAMQQVRFNSGIANFVSEETGEIEAPYGVLVKSQILHVIKLLETDPDSRQAILSLYSEQHQHPMLNVPCTCTLQFFVRHNKLELVTYMRSNDLWWGTPYDVFQFTAMQEIIATALGKYMGPYTHVAGSGHLYEPFFEAGKSLVFNFDPGGPNWPTQDWLFENVDYETNRLNTLVVLDAETRANGTEAEHARYNLLLPYAQTKGGAFTPRMMTHLRIFNHQQKRKREREAKV